MIATQDTGIKIFAKIRVVDKSLNLEESESAYLLMWNESELVDLLVQRLGKTRAEVSRLLKTIQDQTQNRKESLCLATP